MASKLLKVVSLLSSVAVLQAVPAMAQSSAPPADRADNQGGAPVGAGVPAENAVAAGSDGTVAGLDIIVTAQRRSESLARTPVAVAVVSGDSLAKQSIVSQADLQLAVPGLTVKASQSSDQLNYAIRGQSLDPFSSVRPGVLPYFNEVQVGGAGSTAFYDLQSVQVLKGPQGTLFGRNATGGAVLFTSTKPTEDFGGYVSGRLGNYNLAQIEGAVNVPIATDTVLARVAGFYERRKGFQYNIFDGKRVGNVRRYGFRGSLTLHPTEDLTNTLVVDYLHSGGSSISSVLYTVLPPGTQPPGATIAPIPANFLFTPAVDTAFGPGAFARYLAAHPGADPDGLVAEVVKQKARGPFRINVDTPNQHRANNLVLSNVTTYDLSENVQFKNVFGYTRIKSFDRAEFDGSSFGIDGLGPQGLRVKLQQVSEEAQLIGKALSERLSYVAGVYYSREKLDYRSQSIIFDLTPNAPLTDQINSSRTISKSYAGYGQGTYDLSDATGINGLSLTAGLRYTIEKVDFHRNPDDVYIVNPQPPFLIGDQNATYKKLSWQFGIQDQVNADLLLYAVTRRSFRSGGFNSIAPPIAGFGNEGGSEYKPEITTDIELGAKFRGQVGTVPLRLNIAAYNLWDKEIQRVTYAQILGTPSAITVNVPRAKVTGVEIDGVISPASWLNLGGSLNYANGRFTSNLVAVAGGPPVAFGPFPDLAEYSGSAFAEITVPVSGDLKASLRGDLYAQTKTVFSSAQRSLNPGAKIPGYSLTDFRIGLEDTNAGWSIAAQVKNVFDKVYYVGGLPFESVFALSTAVPGAPRTFVVTARKKF